MKTSSAIALASITLAATGAGLAFAAPNVIDATSINGATTDQTRAKYRAAFGTARTDQLEGGITRMVFDGSKTEVYLGKNKRGKVIVTGNSAYKTASGVGPCSSAADLKAAFPGLKAIPGTQGRAYKYGDLWFSVQYDVVHVVALVPKPPPTRATTFLMNSGVKCSPTP